MITITIYGHKTHKNQLQSSPFLLYYPIFVYFTQKPFPPKLAQAMPGGFTSTIYSTLMKNDW